MSSIAKLFQNGQSQAVRLPKEFRFENQKEVFIKRVGSSIVLMPKNDKSVWDRFFDTFDDFSDDFEIVTTNPKERN